MDDSLLFRKVHGQENWSSPGRDIERANIHKLVHEKSAVTPERRKCLYWLVLLAIFVQCWHEEWILHMLTGLLFGLSIKVLSLLTSSSFLISFWAKFIVVGTEEISVTAVFGIHVMMNSDVRNGLGMLIVLLFQLNIKGLSLYISCSLLIFILNEIHSNRDGSRSFLMWYIYCDTKDFSSCNEPCSCCFYRHQYQ